MTIAPYAAIQKRGVLTLNGAAYELLGSPTHARVRYGEIGGVFALALSPSNGTIPEAYAFRRGSADRVLLNISTMLHDLHRLTGEIRPATSITLVHSMLMLQFDSPASIDTDAASC